MLNPQDFKQIVSGQRRDSRAAVWRGALWAASHLYRVGINRRNRQFDTGRRPIEKVEVPVISVGNLTLGGTGKTPLVAWLARWFRQHGVRVTLISRGYGAEQGGQNDEAKELELLLPDVPHLQNPDRVEAARVAIEELGAQVLLLDDAYQHRRIARDLDIVLIDATEPFGHDHLFPRGTLREPLESLKRADLLVLTRGDMVTAEQRAAIWDRLSKYNGHAPQVELHHDPSGLSSYSGHSEATNLLRGRRVLAFCGIGNPEGFRHTLGQTGLNIIDLKIFADHHDYRRADIDSLTQWAQSHPEADALVCTMKDLVKIGLDTLDSRPLWALCIEAVVAHGQEHLEEKLQALLHQLPPDPYAD